MREKQKELTDQVSFVVVLGGKKIVLYKGSTRLSALLINLRFRETAEKILPLAIHSVLCRKPNYTRCSQASSVSTHHNQRALNLLLARSIFSINWCMWHDLHYTHGAFLRPFEMHINQLSSLASTVIILFL